MIWLIGHRGMLGAQVAAHLNSLKLEWEGSDREVDIRRSESLDAFAERIKPRWIINCAAYTAVDAAEDDVQQAYALNAEGPALIGQLASKHAARLIHLSTDYVFDGTSSRPYTETDPISPLSVYGKSKAAGELAAIASCAQTYILRTAWLYGPTGDNFVRKMLARMKAQPQLKVVADQRGTPTNAKDLAGAIITVLRSASDRFGTYHVTNGGETTWYDFALAIRDEALAAGLLSQPCEIVPIPASEYPTKAARPRYSVLSKEKIRNVFGLEMPPWRESLRRFLHEQYVS